jgi:hypothetical protein
LLTAGPVSLAEPVQPAAPHAHGLAGSAADMDGWGRGGEAARPGRVLRAVIDSSVIVGGLLRRRRTAALEVVEMALQRSRLVGVTSPALLEEVFRLLSFPWVRRLAKPPLDDDLIDRVVGQIGERFDLTPGLLEVGDTLEGAVQSPPLLAALEAGVDLIISDDEELATATVTGRRAVRVCAPSAFLRYGFGPPLGPV